MTPSPLVASHGMYGQTQGSVGISQLAEGRLRNSCYCAVRTVTCDYHDGVLVLRGRVPAYYLKQVAQTVVANLEHVGEIANDIEVVRPRIAPARD